KELEWRVGSPDHPTSDQGRDIEAQFSLSSPDADVVRQKWWFECKGRSRTVEPDAVKSAVNNVQATSEVDVLVVVTNTSFSNSTRNWVSDWRKGHPRPHVKLWDKTDLERLLCRYPAARIRLFSSSLTTQGRLVVLRERFWQHSAYMSTDNLKELWNTRKDLEWDAGSIIAVIASEFANGSVNRHPWLVTVSSKNLLHLLRLALAGTPSFGIRAQEAGVDEGSYLDAVGYLILRTLECFPVKEVMLVLRDFMDVPEQKKVAAQS